MSRPNPFLQTGAPEEGGQVEENPFKRDLKNKNPFIEQAPELDRFGQPIGQELDTSVPGPAYESDQGRLSSAGGAFMRGFGGIISSLPKAIGEGSVILANQFGDDPIWGNPDKLTPEDTTAYQIGESIDKWFNKFAVNPKYQDEFLASALPQGAGSMAGFLAGGFAARVAGMPAWLASGGLGATATGVEQVDDYLRELKDDEKADPEVREAAFGLGAALGTTEAAPIQLMLNRLDVFTGGTVTQILKEGFKGGLEELTQEVIQSVGQNYIAKEWLAYDPDRGLFTGTQEAGEVGFTLGFVLNTLAASIGARRAGRLRDPGDETGDGKIELPDIEAPIDAMEVVGQELPEREDEVVQQRSDDVPPPEAFEPTDIDEADIKLGREQPQYGGTYVPDGAEIDPMTGDVVETPSISYFDNRLKRDIYRDRLKHLVDEELVPGGGVALVPDYNFVGGESDTRDENGRPQAPLVRTPSLNPEWFQNLMQDSNYQMSVEKIRHAAEKAIAGERLGVRQARVLGAILDHITAERLDQVDFVRKQLQVARDARAAAGLQPADDWLFEEEEYPEDFDGLSRTFAELLDQAQQLDEGLANQVEVLMESQQTDAEVLAAITNLIGEFNGRKSQENAGLLAQTQEQAAVPDTGAEPLAGEPAAETVGTIPAEQPTGRRPAESLPAEQEVTPAAPSKSMEQFQTGDRVRITAEGFNNIEGTLTEEAMNGFMVEYTDPELGYTEEQFIELEDLEIVEKQLPQDRVAKARAEYEAAERRKKKQPGRKKERRQVGQEDRRRQWAYRKDVDEMSPEERKAVIETLRQDALVNQMTGLGSKMAWEDAEKKQFIGAIDADSLKYVNDNLGKDAGDQLLIKIGKALHKEFGEDAYHISGDEFWVHGDNQEDVETKLFKAQGALETETVEGPGGSLTGLGFSFGVSTEEQIADREMKADKKARTKTGERAERGEQPHGVTLKEKPAEAEKEAEEEYDPAEAWAQSLVEYIDPDSVTVLIKGESLFASWTFKMDVPADINLDNLEDKGFFNSYYRGDRSYTFQEFWNDPQKPVAKLRIVDHEDGTATITYTEDWPADAKDNWPKYKQAKKGAPEHLNVDQRDGNIEADENITEELKEQGNAIGRQLEMDANDFRDIMQEYGSLFTEPDKKLNHNATLTKNGPYISQDEAADLLATWKENARQQGLTSKNSNRIVLSFFDLTGEWSKPWVEAGYDVYQFDLQNMDDIMDWSVEYMNELFGGLDNVYAILAAPPCTDYTSAINRDWWKKNLKGHTEASNELVQQVMRTVNYLKPSVWALENPVGRISTMTGLPSWRLLFDPSNFGQPYTKKTAIYGRFDADNMPLANVDPVEGSKMASKWGGSSQATKNARAETPEGFAYSFFMANNAADNPVMAITGKYDQLNADLLRRAVEAGITEQEIDEAVEDFYWQELDYESADEQLTRLLERKGEKGRSKKKQHPGKKPKAEAPPVEITEEEDEKQTFKVTIEGIEATVTHDGNFPKIKGKLASSTGFRSFASFDTTLEDLAEGATLAEKAQNLAQQMYDKQAGYAFMVWQDQKEAKWKDISTFGGEHEIRLPQWHEGKVAAVLEEAGFTQDGHQQANTKWAIPEDRIKVKDLRKALGPIHNNNTRFADEQQLADELRDSLQAAGMMEGFELTAQTEEQLTEKEAKVRKAQEREAVPPPEAFELEGEITPIEQSAAQPDMFSAIDAEAHEAAASPLNGKTAPSKKQIEANNFAKGHPTIQGFKTAIENPENSWRYKLNTEALEEIAKGDDYTADGVSDALELLKDSTRIKQAFDLLTDISRVQNNVKKAMEGSWIAKLAAHYGDLVGTIGADGDPIDVFIKPGLDEVPADAPIFVIDQKVKSKFDEHKVMMGFNSRVDAKNAYTGSYEQGWDGIQEMTQTTPDELRAWTEELKADETKRKISFGDWTRSRPEYVLATKPIHWLMQHAERVTTFEGEQQVDTWKFNGRLPKHMVNELKQIAKDIPGFRRSSGAKSEKFHFTLENTEQVSDSLVFGFGTTKSTANSINFQRMRYTEGADTQYAEYAGRDVTFEAADPDSGEILEITVDAAELLRDYDNRISMLTRLKEICT